MQAASRSWKKKRTWVLSDKSTSVPTPRSPLAGSQACPSWLCPSWRGMLHCVWGPGWVQRDPHLGKPGIARKGATPSLITQCILVGNLVLNHS
ncbi:unnamed protein product [Nyctereutes procyonoides]|uniref:(raccoon dog) hypothetical protein n=1 Tax=Nyctereutes procyonoides TaxID=34880 RepID=A0A811YTR5_NYCPR|nr:unnamed protein product [Nyctereutes procyonoides]